MKIEKIKNTGILGAVRQRMGADDENDTSKDNRIEQLSPEDCVAKWAGWYLGDESWATTIIHYYTELSK